MAHQRSGRPRRWRGAVLVLALALSASACGQHEPTPVASTSSTPPPPPPPPPPVPWPLTGVDSAGADMAHPALAVKIENSADARPQTGLNSADMVWEEVVEGGITRFVAVFHSTLPPDMDPIRSVRPMDPAIAAPLHGLLAFSGGQADFVAAVGDAGLQVISHDRGDEGFYRKSGRFAPHNVYADPATFLAQADAAHAAPPGPQFVVADEDAQPSAVTAGTPATTLTLQLSGVSRPRWTWSQPDGRWVRAEGTTPAVEADGTPLRAANVVVLRVAVVNTRYSDPAGNPVPETQMVGAGEALVASGGRTLPATWTKSSEAEPVALTGADGRPILLAPGNTWIELVPTRTGAVTVG